MNDEHSGPVHRSSFIVHRFLIVALFFALRVPLLLVRQPFFDELFTRWIGAKPFAEILGALHYDSGPPFYYFIVHLIGDPSIPVLRGVSLLFATIALVALLVRNQIVAAALLAVFPPAVLFSVDARAYALCGMFVTIGVLLIDERPFAAALSLVAAAYSHYYGVLFFPLFFTKGRLKAALTLLLFAPGAWLALHQPRGSMAWIGPFPQYPDILFARPPLWLLIVAGLLVVAAAYRLNRYTAMTLIPLAIALVLRIYFPLRFEAVIAAPLVLWLALSARKTLIPPLIAVGILISVFGIVDHAHRPLDDYRAAAEYVRTAPAPVIASGYLYLETTMLRPATAFPAEQALHPGWRVAAKSGSELPPSPFIWIGERLAPELTLIQRTRRVTPLYVNEHAAVVRVN